LEENLSQPAQLAFFHEFGLSRLNPIFFKIGVEPAQIDFFFRWSDCAQKSVIVFFGHFWVEPGQLGFLTFGFSRDVKNPGAEQMKKNVKKSSFWGTVHMDSG